MHLSGILLYIHLSVLTFSFVNVGSHEVYGAYTYSDSPDGSMQPAYVLDKQCKPDTFFCKWFYAYMCFILDDTAVSEMYLLYRIDFMCR